MWFPRPRTPRDIRTLGPSGELDAEQLFALLSSPSACEWRDKVGVSSPDDGSAKSTTRLLHADGWVFKTDTLATDPDPARVMARLAEPLRLAVRVELWHPHKRWFLLRSAADGEADDAEQQRWWPVSVCPRLTSLRALHEWPAFTRMWARALSLALLRSRQHGVGLDLNPSNFGVGREPDADIVEPGVWYLDDETYAALELADVAEAIVGRIPEWPELDEHGWREFGLLLHGLLEPVLGGAREWQQLAACVREVLLAPRWHGSRAALLQGLERSRPHASASSSSAQAPMSEHPSLGRRVALIADVHANLAALDAVIGSAARERVDGWMFLGDAVGYGPSPNACVARLAALPKFVGVRGNHDQMACYGIDPQANGVARRAMQFTREQLGEAELDWLRALPVEQGGDGWLAVHGAPVDPQRFHAYVYTMSCRRNLDHLRAGTRRLCFHGHTHVPMVYRATVQTDAEGLRPMHGGLLELAGAEALLINPGSVGQPRDGDSRASYAIWDRDAGTVEFLRIAYQLGPVLAAIREAGLPDDLALRLELGR